MYKELVMVRNNRNTWDYIFNISLSEINPIYTKEEAINLINLDLSNESIKDFIVTDNEIYIVTDYLIECKNCGDNK